MSVVVDGDIKRITIVRLFMVIPYTLDEKMMMIGISLDSFTRGTYPSSFPCRWFGSGGESDEIALKRPRG